MIIIIIITIITIIMKAIVMIIVIMIIAQMHIYIYDSMMSCRFPASGGFRLSMPGSKPLSSEEQRRRASALISSRCC